MPASASNQTNDLRLTGLDVSIPLVMLFQASALIIRSFVDVNMVEAGIDAPAARHLSALIGFAVLFIFMWPLMNKAWPAIRQLFRRPETWSRMVLASVMLGFVLWLSQMLVLVAIAPLQWIGDGPYKWPTAPIFEVACSNPANLLLALPVMSMLTPLVEEIINRGLFLGTLLPRGRLIAIMGSALLFTVFHVPGGMASAFIFGIFAAIQMLHYRTLWAVVITHGTGNLFVEIHRNCVDGYWLPGHIPWEPGSPALLIALLTPACIFIAWRLATCSKAGAADFRCCPGIRR